MDQPNAQGLKLRLSLGQGLQRHHIHGLKEGLRYAKGQARDRNAEQLARRGNKPRCAGGIPGIVASDDRENLGNILCTPGQGPPWSRDEAKAIMPQRETRP